MTEKTKLDIFTRCHTVLPPKPEPKRTTMDHRADVQTWPPYICCLDTETTEDLELASEFGAYQFCKLTANGYAVEEQGLIFNDDLNEQVSCCPQRFCRSAWSRVALPARLR